MDIINEIFKAYEKFHREYARIPESLYLGQKEYIEFKAATKSYVVTSDLYSTDPLQYNGMKVYELIIESHLAVA